MHEALKIIRDEHHTLYRIIDVVESEMRALKPGAKPNFALLRKVVEYFDIYVEAYHHPKESIYLFPVLYKALPDLTEILDRLDADHRKAPARLRDLLTALTRYEDHFPDGREALEAAMRGFLAGQSAHLKIEEGAIFAAADARLSAEDWAPLDAALTDPSDPVMGPDALAAARRLYREVVNTVPAPYGMGG